MRAAPWWPAAAAAAAAAALAAVVLADVDPEGVPYAPIRCRAARECGCSGAGAARCGKCPDDEGSRNIDNDVCWCEGTAISPTGNECNPLKVDAPFARVAPDADVAYEPILCGGAAECGCSGGGEARCGRCPDDRGSANVDDDVCWCFGDAATASGNECHPRKQDGPFRVAEPPPGPRACTADGALCAGVPGKPFVKYSPCCDERLECGVPKKQPAGEWGQRCIEPSAVDAGATAAANVAATRAPTRTVRGTSATASPSGNSGSGSNGNATGGTGGDAAAAPSDDDDGSVCFPGDASVTLRSGAVVPMRDVSIGDVVAVGAGEYSRVFMFTHKTAATKSHFISIAAASGETLTLTAGHYLYVNGALAAAKTVRVGDRLTLGSGLGSPVVAVESACGTGLYNPQTVKGDIVVNGLLASTYTTTVEPVFAHAILAPLRLLHRFGVRFSALEAGGGPLTNFLPRGKAVV